MDPPFLEEIWRGVLNQNRYENGKHPVNIGRSAKRVSVIQGSGRSRLLNPCLSNRGIMIFFYLHEYCSGYLKKKVYAICPAPWPENEICSSTHFD